MVATMPLEGRLSTKGKVKREINRKKVRVPSIGLEMCNKKPPGYGPGVTANPAEGRIHQQSF